MVLPALAAGLGLGGGLSLFEGQQADNVRDSNRQQSLAFENVLRQSFQSDPLLNQILGSLAGQQGAAFNPDEVYQAGREQIDLTRQRREFDALRRLAAGGFDAGGQQQQQFNAESQQLANTDQGNLRDLVDLTYQQQNPQLQLQDFNLFTSLLGPTLALGGSAGILGNRAPGPGTAPNSPSAGQVLGGLVAPVTSFF